MLRSARNTRSFSLAAKDGRIGHVREFYFDDHRWTIRYLVAQAGNWLTGRRVLLSPHSLGPPDDSRKVIPVDLTREQIRQSPSPGLDVPLSRSFERDYYRYFGWPYYWVGPHLWGPSPYPVLPAVAPAEPPAAPGPAAPEAAGSAPHGDRGDSNLRSTDETTGYRVQARDGGIGHAEDFLYDDKDWSIRFLVMDTRNLWGGRWVLVPPAWIAGFRWEERSLEVDADRDDLRNAPEYDPKRPVSEEYAKQLARHFEIYSLERHPG